MKVFDSLPDDEAKFNELLDSVGLASILLVVMTILTYRAIAVCGTDLLIVFAIALVNGAIGAIFAGNYKVWVTQMNSYRHRECWSKEQIKLAAIGTVLVACTLGAAYFGLKYGNRIDKMFGAVFLLLPLPLARLARNAIVSHGIARQQRPTVYES